MASSSKTRELLRRKKRDFINKRGRMGRSPFFANLCIASVMSLVYILILYLVVYCLDEAGVPRTVYNNVYYLSAGALYILMAFLTRGLRLKRLRDMGLPVWSDWPFMLLLLSTGLGPFFYFFDVPYLRNLDVVNMPENLRDLLGVIWLIWLLVLILAPSKHRENIFTCAPKLEENPSPN